MLLKHTHPLCISYHLFLSVWTGAGIQFSENFGLYPDNPAQFLHSIQLVLSVYWQTAKTLGVSEARILTSTDFFSLLMSVRVQSWALPIMPGLPPVTLSPAFSGIGTPTNLPTPTSMPSGIPTAPQAPGYPATPIHIAVANPTIYPIVWTDM